MNKIYNYLCYTFVLINTFANVLQTIEQTNCLSNTFPITLGGYKYEKYDVDSKYIFCNYDDCDSRKKFLPYPLEQQYPRYKLGESITRTCTTNLTEINKIFGKYINQSIIEEEEPLVNMLTIKGDIGVIYKLNYLYFGWNEKITYLLVDIYEIEEGNYFNLGKRLGSQLNFNFNDSRAYIVSLGKIKRIGVQLLGELETSSEKLLNLGGKNFSFRLFDISQSKVEITFKHETLENQVEKVMAERVKDSDVFYLKDLSPFLWYSGIYLVEVEVKSQMFRKRVNVYPQSNSVSYLNTFHVKEVDDIIFYSNNLTSITLSVKSSDINSSTNHNVAMVIYKFTRTNDFKFPYSPKPNIKEYNFNCNFTADNTSFSQCILPLIELYNSEIDPLNDLGRFSLLLGRKKIFTNYFNLMWLADNSNENNTIIRMETYCQGYIQQPKSNKVYSCPTSSFMAQNLQTRFRRSSKLFNSELECFEEIISSYSDGETCCYNNETNLLVYGNNFYLNETRRDSGSYKWNFSPTFDFERHWLYDRMPLSMCCVWLANDVMCNKLWTNQHHFETKNEIMDSTANIVGDPHIISFYYNLSHNFIYSYVQNGFYHLLNSHTLNVDIQGLFYGPGKEYSSMKGIAIKSDDITISITPVWPGFGMLKWNITLYPLQKKFNVLFLPYVNKDFLLFEDGKSLKIYILKSNQKKIMLSLTRDEFKSAPLAYMNMELSLSSHAKQDFDGGIFGNKFNLEPLNQTIMTANNVSAESMLFNLKDSYGKIVVHHDKTIKYSSADGDCEGVEICLIDKFQFPKLQNLYLATRDLYKARKLLDENLVRAHKVPGQCSRPDLSDAKIIGSNYSEGSQLKINECINPNNLLNYKNVILVCRNNTGTLNWISESNINLNQICEAIDDNIITPKPDMTVYIASGTASVLLLIILLVVVVFFILHKRKNRIQMMPTNTVNNVEPAHTVMELGVYDNPSPVVDDEYFIYTDINKNKTMSQEND